MIAKEWRGARWTLVAGALAFVAGVLLVLTPYGELVAIVKETPGALPDPAELARRDVVGAHRVGSALILVPLAAVLGVALISGEVSKGTIFLALSKPISRDRLLLAKYATGAGILLVVALIGSAGSIVSAYVHGYPSSSFVIMNILLSAVLIWLGSLCVLGTALLLSVVFRDVIKSVIATGLAVCVILKFPRDFLNYSLWMEYHRLGVPERLVDRLRLPYYWSSDSLYSGDGWAVTNLFVCSIAAALPLLAALWLFRRKEY